MPKRKSRKPKKITRKEYVAEILAVEPAKLPNKLWTTKLICSVYRISPFTMRNYRKGFYFNSLGEVRWLTQTHDKLKHIRQGQEPLTANGGDLKYTIPWINEYLRLIGKEQRIPPFLRHL